MIAIILMMLGCQNQEHQILEAVVIQTNASGDKLKVIETFESSDRIAGSIEINPNIQYQTITGFGAAFTESSAFILNELSQANYNQVLSSYFSDTGAQYSLTRTHMNSCDFSLDHYSYAPIQNDSFLNHFNISPDSADIIPMIQRAQGMSTEGFKIIASPWTAPIWMKDNKDWNGGKLNPDFYPSWSLFFSKYAKAYEAVGIPIWAFTVENEPLGNDAHWESMHYTPEEMSDFVKHHLGPQFEKDSITSKILVYDQNRGKELDEWASVMLTDSALLSYIYGTAVHWYASTTDWYPKSLNYVHNLAPDKHIIHTEGCVDSEVPHWNDDQRYWKKEATDWGWDWAKEEDKKDHPKYVPCHRYARDIIGCLNNWVEGWVDWNMILDRNGGPNLANNWCVAPVIADIEKDQVYYTPLYYVLSHFSKYIRPGAVRIGIDVKHPDLMATAAKNIDGTIAVVVFNGSNKAIEFELNIEGKCKPIKIEKNAIQTILLHN